MTGAVARAGSGCCGCGRSAPDECSVARLGSSREGLARWRRCRFVRCAAGPACGEMKAPRLAGRDTCFAAVAVVRPDPPVAPEFRARNRTGDTAILPTYRLAHALAARDSGDNPTGHRTEAESEPAPIAPRP